MKHKLTKRRKLRQSDFRKHIYRRDEQVLLAKDSQIRLDVIRDKFPDEQDRYDYINGLIEGFDRDLM